MTSAKDLEEKARQLIGGLKDERLLVLSSQLLDALLAAGQAVKKDATCPTCGVGKDTNGDGDCPVCASVLSQRAKEAAAERLGYRMKEAAVKAAYEKEGWYPVHGSHFGDGSYCYIIRAQTRSVVVARYFRGSFYFYDDAGYAVGVQANEIRWWKPFTLVLPPEV
jgi:hypothetical protein